VPEAAGASGSGLDGKPSEAGVPLTRSTSRTEKLLESVLDAIVDSQTRFYVQWFCMIWV
jgi:hypothetical protein